MTYANQADRWRSLANRYMTVTLPGLYRTEQGRKDLEDIYGLYARVDSLLLNIRDQVLAKCTDPATCDALFIEHLASVVGIDSRVPWFFLLSEAEQRRIIASGAILWNEKGTGYRNPTRAIVGGKYWICDWFAARDLVAGELSIYELEDPLGAADAEYRTFVHHVNAGALSAAILDQAFDSFRPVLERVVRHEVLFLDDFLEGLGQWATTGPVTLIDGMVTIEDETMSTVKVLGSTYYTLHARFQLPAGENGVISTFLNGAGDGYLIVIEDGSVLLLDTVTGLLAAATPVILPGYTHSIRIVHNPSRYGTAIRVILNGTDVLSYIPGVGDPTYSPGQFNLSAAAGQHFSVLLVEAIPS